MLLYSTNISTKQTKFEGGGADDIGKQIIGMFIGSLENPKLEYNSNGLSLKITTSSKSVFNVFYGSLDKLSPFSIKRTTKIINLEFNESYKIKHRIKMYLLH